MANIIVSLLILALVGYAVYTIRKSRKNGKCAGCPYAASCSGQSNCDSVKNVESRKVDAEKNDEEKV